MRKVFSSHDSLLAGYLASLLEARGIACVVKNQFLGGAAGELPPTECWPEIWVADDRDETPALRVLAAYHEAGRESFDRWTCPTCGEALEGQFEICWRCGTERPVRTP
jgi:hypothetical protein